jgi:DNA-binding NtrC family response regulator
MAASELYELHHAYGRKAEIADVADKYLQAVQQVSGSTYSFISVRPPSATSAESHVSAERIGCVTRYGSSTALTRALGEMPFDADAARHWIAATFGPQNVERIKHLVKGHAKVFCASIIERRKRALGLIVIGGDTSAQAAGNSEQIEYCSQELIRILDRICFSRWSHSIGQPSYLIGMSPLIAHMELIAARFAAADCPVLITGETGTGKELVARLLHYFSPRRNGPFVAVNCGAFTSDELLASELFGHVRGAFTDAYAPRRGKFELADGGTLFLDEVGCMSPIMQVALLRVLRYGDIQRVGEDSVSHKTNARIIAACNEDLSRLVKIGRFREDIHSRLRVAQLNVPPLRDRKEDIPLLADYFLNRFAAHTMSAIKLLSPEALDRLVIADWPDNVAGLENSLYHAHLLSDSVITREHLPFDGALSTPGKSSSLVPGPPPNTNGASPHCLRDALERFEANYISQALDSTHGNITQAAKVLGLTRQGLQKKLRRFKLHEAPVISSPDVISCGTVSTTTQGDQRDELFYE